MTTIPLTGDDARLDHLINDEGLDQVTASQLLWAPGLILTHADAPLHRRLVLEQVRREARQIVREGLADVLTWLRGAA